MYTMYTMLCIVYYDMTWEALSKQLDAWVEYGTIERDVADALKLVQQNQQEFGSQHSKLPSLNTDLRSKTVNQTYK